LRAEIDETLAPVVLFTYNRPKHTLSTLRSLSQCALSQNARLFVYCDGPKNDYQRDDVARVREAVRSHEWCAEVNVIERDHNFGLARSIITGVSQQCEQYGKVIVLEDDLLLAPMFLAYMNAALDRYQADEKAMQVSGYSFTEELEVEDDAVFLPFTTTWGWATWARAWDAFDPLCPGYEQLRDDSATRSKFDLYGAYPYFELLEQQLQGRVDSWGICWYLSVFIRSGLTLFPVRSLVHNTGFDGSGTHEGKLRAPRTERASTPVAARGTRPIRFPTDVSESSATPDVIRAVARMNRRTLLRRGMDRLQGFLA
jgi:GNT-I family